MTKQTKAADSGKNRDKYSPNDTQFKQGALLFPIVGIGASAGGLEALELFLRHVPDECGMAFVIVQHLDPNYKGMMAELLQRTTKMKVFQVTDRMKVRQNCVYVIPPNADMSILHGVLHLFEPQAARGLRHPIDFFFLSLADDRQKGSIGVILSGMGTDGTLGLKAIKEKGGLVLVQEPASAKFDSMPRSAINAGLADITAPVEDLPEKIIVYLQNTIVISKAEPLLDEKNKSAMEKVIILLRTKSGHDFSQYKKDTLYRRVNRRMGIHQINQIATYVRYLQENPQEAELLFKELLIGVTNFFREPEAWGQLRGEVIPVLLAGHPNGGCLRVWSAGCSSGEEAYSLAIVFKEALEQARPTANFTLQVFATDLSQDAIDKARQGVYPANISAEVSPERLKEFFIKEGSGYRICKEIRSMVSFATHNIIFDPPFTKLDILICRNLLIYLTPEVQQKLIKLFHYSLNPGGFLFLGSSESAGAFTDHFASINNKSRIFKRRETILPTKPPEFLASFALTPQEIPNGLQMLKPSANLQFIVEQMLLQHFSPPAVLTNDKGDILYISGRTGKYLEPTAGKANWNIFFMAREGLRTELGSAFHKAILGNKQITVKCLNVETGVDIQSVDITVQAITGPEELRGMVIITFTDVATTCKKTALIRSKTAQSDNTTVLDIMQILQQVREDLQSTREEMQATQEELSSSNEELQLTNEELLSTNEELQTVNDELHSKMNELSRVDNDMRNLLNSTEIVTLFLDIELNVKRFTTGAHKLFKLIQVDVGRPLSDIVNDLLYPEMSNDAQEVLRTLAFSEKQITTTDGRWYSVRIMPYRTMEDVIAGVVLTFSNITVFKKIETELREENERLKSSLEVRS